MGLARAKAQGKRIGRPPTQVDEDAVHRFRKAGLSLRGCRSKTGYFTDESTEGFSQKAFS